jgi:hypothetical protein
MADTLLTSIPGLAQIQAVSVGSATQNATQTPSELSGLPIGTYIRGFVINRDRSNNPILRTDQGDVLVRSDVFLKTGAQVTIRIEQIASQLRARIITVDDIPIKDIIEQQQQLPPKDDIVLQPSIAPRVPAALSQTAATAIVLDAVLLESSGSSTTQGTHVLSSSFVLSALS